MKNHVPYVDVGGTSHQWQVCVPVKRKKISFECASVELKTPVEMKYMGHSFTNRTDFREKKM